MNKCMMIMMIYLHVSYIYIPLEDDAMKDHSLFYTLVDVCLPMLLRYSIYIHVHTHHHQDNHDTGTLAIVTMYLCSE